MKITIMMFLLLMSFVSEAGDTLRCTGKYSRHLTVITLKEFNPHAGCTFTYEETVNGRYSITQCHEKQAEGVLEFMDKDGHWILVEEFSTETNCQLLPTFKPIRTNYPCGRAPERNGHRGGCNIPRTGH